MSCMTRHQHLLTALDPHEPSTITALLDFHRLTFGAAVMGPDDPPKDDPDKGDPDKGDPKPDKPQGDPAGLGDAGKKALDEERSARSKAERDLKATQAKLKEIEDKNLTEDQRKDKERTEAIEARDNAQALALRYEVAAEKGLPLSMAKRLVGSTREQIEADAEVLKKDIPTGGSTPKPDPSAGKGGGDKNAKASVGAGRDLYRDMHPTKK